MCFWSQDYCEKCGDCKTVVERIRSIPGTNKLVKYRGCDCGGHAFSSTEVTIVPSGVKDVERILTLKRIAHKVKLKRERQQMDIDAGII